MSLIKKITPILIILFVMSLVWVGFSVYFQTTGIDIDPNATNYTKPISPSFDLEVLEEVSTKTQDSFPVSPSEFLELNQLD